MIRALTVALALLAAAPALADCTVLSSPDGSGTVYLPQGPVTGQVVVLVDHRIEAVQTEPVAAPGPSGRVSWRGQDCAYVDTSGKQVTAGLVDVDTQLGLVEVGMEDATVDHAGGRDDIHAALRVADAYNPRSTLIPITRVQGVTSALIVPTGGLVSGRSAWVELAGSTQVEALADASVAVHAHVTGPSKAEGLLRLAELLDDARWFSRNRAAWEQNRARPLTASGPDLEALKPVILRAKPLVIGADRSADIEALLRFQQEQGIRIVIRGGAEAWMHADDLARAKVPVIVDSMVYGAGSFGQIHGRPDNAALLAAAGVKVMFTASDSHNARLVRQYAGNAVRSGMPHDAALEALTATPAKVFGQRDRGEIAPGQIANVVVWSGDPLELMTAVEHVFIHGRPIGLQTRQTLLHDRYRTLPGSPLEPLPLP